MNSPTVFYHVAAMNHWKQVVQEQLDLLRSVGLVDLRVTFVGDPAGIEWLREEGYSRGIKIEVLCHDANVMHYETFAMFEMEKWAKDNDGPVLYLHTKGVSAPGHEGK